MGPCFMSTEDRPHRLPFPSATTGFNGAVLHEHGRLAGHHEQMAAVVVASMGPCFMSTEDYSAGRLANAADWLQWGRAS